MTNRFEGNEKKLELDFVVPPSDPLGIRSLPRAEWDLILTDGHCTIVSQTSNSSIDSYVLSESSLFVFRHKAIIKTCGTTTLLDCLPRFLETCLRYGYEFDFLQYSRRNFFFPTDQVSVHRDFETEVDWLDALFPGEYGGANVLGNTGGRWYVYTLDRGIVPHHHRCEQTMEVCMYQLDPDALKYYFRDWCLANCPAGSLTPESSPQDVAHVMSTAGGFRKLCEGIALALKAEYPSLREEQLLVDEFAFAPCGYSVNVILGGVYMTVHITPEQHQCYVSFETNAQCAGYTDLVREVVEVFRPAHFAVNMSADRHSIIGATGAVCGEVDGFVRAAFRQKMMTKTLIGSTHTYYSTGGEIPDLLPSKSPPPTWQHYAIPPSPTVRSPCSSAPSTPPHSPRSTASASVLLANT